ncbi:MAG: hypothetical protein V9G12_10440 [Microthrixaceae bacterium]
MLPLRCARACSTDVTSTVATAIGSAQWAVAPSAAISPECSARSSSRVATADFDATSGAAEPSARRPTQSGTRTAAIANAAARTTAAGRAGDHRHADDGRCRDGGRTDRRSDDPKLQIAQPVDVVDHREHLPPPGAGQARRDEPTQLSDDGGADPAEPPQCCVVGRESFGVAEDTLAGPRTPARRRRRRRGRRTTGAPP